MDGVRDAVVCHERARETVRVHVESDLEREVGGFLAGRLIDGVAHVALAVPALRAEGHRANVTFTHDVWDDVLATLDREHPELQLVGWYHSHPGFGIFLSEYDRFIQNNFFPADGMVALVVDPRSGADGWFATADGEVTRLDGPEAVSTPRDRPLAAPTQGERWTGSATRGTLALVGVAALLVGLVGGWFIGDPGADTVAATDVEAELAATEARAADLREDLEEAVRRAETAEAELASASDERSLDAADDDQRDGFTYRVRRGDTLRSIARMMAPDEEGYLVRIVEANPQLDDPDILQIGSALQLPLPLEPEASGVG